MPRKTYQPRQHRTAPCSHCQGPVKITKPSSSGHHFCREPECQAAKSKTYYRARATQAAAGEKYNILMLVHAIAHRPRRQCPQCGLVNALPGYAHPDQTGSACQELGSAKMGGLANEFVESLWPTPSREYAEVEA